MYVFSKCQTRMYDWLAEEIKIKNRKGWSRKKEEETKENKKEQETKKK